MGKSSKAGEAGVRLTPRESQALEWTLKGKTAWELAQILGISERTAIKFLQSAMRKFDVRSKHQAALAAFRLGLIGIGVQAAPSPSAAAGGSGREGLEQEPRREPGIEPGTQEQRVAECP